MDTRLPHATTAGTRTTVLRRLGIAPMLLGLAMSFPAAAQDAAAAAPSGAAAAADLRAVFIDVSGKVQWRPDDKQPWRDASVNDEVAPGVEVRTGLRSHAALRMRNATVLLDAGTVFQLPVSVQDGEVLRTTAAIKHGRADFKVDKVGLSNDFKVVTPSTTLAVRGTEFAIATGALKQVEVIGARRNAINAIELKYALNNTTVQLSGSSTSSSTVNHPAHQSAVAASPPLAAAAAPPATSQSETVRTASAGETPASSGSPAAVQQGNRSTARAEKASGSSGGGETGVVSRIQEQVAEANARASQAIAILLASESPAAEVEFQRDAIVALGLLAEARRAEAVQALADHESALVDALALRVSYLADRETFLTTADAVDGTQGHFARFDAGASAARDLIGQIAGLGSPGDGDAPAATVAALVPGQGDGSQSPGGPDESDLIAQLRATLELMGEDLQLAAADRDGLADLRSAMEGVIDQVRVDAEGESLGSAAEAAIAAYQQAIAALEESFASGGTARAAASDAVEAVRAAKTLVVALRDSTPTLALNDLAGSALARLETATANLGEATSLLAQIEADLAEARADEDPSSENYARRERLGQVAAIYGQLVELQAATVLRLTGIETGVNLRADEFADLHEQAGAGLVTFAQLRAGVLGALGLLAEAEGLGDAQVGTVGAAGQALAAHEAALGSAQQIEGDASDLRDSFLLAAGSVDGSDGHFEGFDAQADAAGGVIAQIVGALGGDGTSEVGLSGASDVPALLAQLQGSFTGMAASLGAAEDARTAMERDRDAIDELLATAGAAAGQDAAAAIADFNAALGRLGTLASSGASALAIIAEAHGAIDGLDELITQVAASGAASPAVLAAARASLANLEAATAALEAATLAHGAIGSVLAAAEDDERRDAFGQVAAALARIGQMSSDAGARLGTVSEGLTGRAASYVELAESGSAVLSAEAARLQVPAEAAFESVDQGFRQLGSMSTASTDYLAALDGAQGAAEDAERSRGSARIERDGALQNEANAAFGREATEFFAAEGDLGTAAAFRNDTRTEADSARGAADRALGHAADAREARDEAIAYAADAARLRPDVEAFGSTREQFTAAAATRLDAVQGALPVLAGLRGDIARYDAVVRDLAARAGTDLASFHAQVSAAAKARADEIRDAVVALGASASAAAQMAETASTNAGRMFGRSVTGYLERAALAYSNPNPDFGRGQQYGAAEFAQQADEAAIRAAAHLAAANAAISAANNGNGQGN
jgi:hypothetical protein